MDASTSTDRSELAEDVDEVDEVLSALERRRGCGWKSIFVDLFLLVW